MCTLHEKLAALGHTLSNTDYTTILLGSLPKSHNMFLSAITTTMSFLEKELEPNALMNSVINKYDY